MPWLVARGILEANGFERAHGWNRTIVKLDSYNDLFVADKIAPLQDSLIEHIICGEKLVSLFEVPRAKLDHLRVLVDQLTVPSGAEEEAYPYIVDEKTLSSLQLGHTIVARHAFPEGTALIISTIRTITTKELIDISSLTSDNNNTSGYRDIIALKSKKIQCLDVLYIPRSGNAFEIRSDLARYGSSSISELNQDSLKKFLAAEFDDSIFSSPVNVFPLISDIYFNRNEGCVVELAFGTTTASLKHERMRRRSICLRNEDYHRGGVAALSTPISPYRLSVEWTVGRGATKTRPELSLNATSRDAASGEGFLGDAVIRNCSGFADFAFVRERLNHYILYKLT
jgi:hypothetical protein